MIIKEPFQSKDKSSSLPYSCLLSGRWPWEKYPSMEGLWEWREELTHCCSQVLSLDAITVFLLLRGKSQTFGHFELFGHCSALFVSKMYAPSCSLFTVPQAPSSVCNRRVFFLPWEMQTPCSYSETDSLLWFNGVAKAIPHSFTVNAHTKAFLVIIL